MLVQRSNRSASFLNLIPEKDCGNAEKKLQYMETLNSNDCPENLGF